MIAFLATTAFFQAVSADWNQTWIEHFAANKDDATTLQGLEALEKGYTCEKLVARGVGYNIKYNKFCPFVSDYALQCAGKNMKPLRKKKQRRLTPKAELEANTEKYGELVSCMERNRYYSQYRYSWLHEKYSTLTCKEVLTTYGSGDCKSTNAKMYAINTCCPATCNTKAELGCNPDEQYNIDEGDLGGLFSPDAPAPAAPGAEKAAAAKAAADKAAADKAAKEKAAAAKAVHSWTDKAAAGKAAKDKAAADKAAKGPAGDASTQPDTDDKIDVSTDVKTDTKTDDKTDDAATNTTGTTTSGASTMGLISALLVLAQ